MEFIGFDDKQCRLSRSGVWPCKKGVGENVVLCIVCGDFVC